MVYGIQRYRTPFLVFLLETVSELPVFPYHSVWSHPLDPVVLVSSQSSQLQDICVSEATFSKVP